ncbi:BZ3500_MvSof-1268-A1-R1_Chr3-3g06474 [Microbotryum saponariae]|uniref:BZ3500_MvSof-1268-A1-R1_Chr3-3g06474 protein n=1 Tax=Microbotryum saponariae TaxID=289078 RepID=A0A2X0LC52_9BASI|nr:BZ3500_MvSof-1268-A1-R1_Chr3-3g06474 [Microbotryum saponariae]SDA04441.1 BZ3501_MvSof-1269-A2-R1_Chr3-2g06161 [Microbotryum saponariae]
MSKPTPTRSTTASYPTFLDLPPNCNSTSTSTSTSPFKALPHHPSISLLPFSITYAGPTDVSSQFPLHPSTPTKRSDGTLELHSEAAFRGRLLISSRVELPQGYRGWVVESRKPAPATIATISTESGKGVEERVVKKAKIEGGRMGGSFRGRGGKVFQKGTRTSPRKKKVVVKYSLDSDEELEGNEVGEDEMMKNREEVEEVEEARTEEEEEERTMVDTPHESIESSSTSTTTTTIPSTLVSLSTSFSSLPDTPKEPEPEPEIENFAEAPLARDEIHLLPIASFASIDLWNPDSAADLATDVYARSLGEWTGIAAKVRYKGFPGGSKEAPRGEGDLWDKVNEDVAC